MSNFSKLEDFECWLAFKRRDRLISFKRFRGFGSRREASPGRAQRTLMTDRGGVRDDEEREVGGRTEQLRARL